MVAPLSKLKLHGFNNLTKSLNVCIYDIHYAKTAEQQTAYHQYIEQRYNADRLTQLLQGVCEIIGANPLNIARQNYEPHGASVTMLVAEEETAMADAFAESAKPGPFPESVVGHLDKSHICIHTYPESHSVNGISTFRADIEISSCGVISPLKALNFLIHSFDSDIVTLDYRVRGFTRDIRGEKHYIDHKIDSIQNFLSSDTCENYLREDINLPQANLFFTKMKKYQAELSSYLVGFTEADLSNEDKLVLSQNIQTEIQQIFKGNNTLKI